MPFVKYPDSDYARIYGRFEIEAGACEKGLEAVLRRTADYSLGERATIAYAAGTFYSGEIGELRHEALLEAGRIRPRNKVFLGIASESIRSSARESRRKLIENSFFYAVFGNV